MVTTGVISVGTLCNLQLRPLNGLRRWQCRGVRNWVAQFESITILFVQFAIYEPSVAEGRPDPPTHRPFDPPRTQVFVDTLQVASSPERIHRLHHAADSIRGTGDGGGVHVTDQVQGGPIILKRGYDPASSIALSVGVAEDGDRF